MELPAKWPAAAAPPCSVGQPQQHTYCSRTLCTFFKEGKCLRGTECRFQHATPVLRHSGGPPPPASRRSIEDHDRSRERERDRSRDLSRDHSNAHSRLLN